MTKKQRNRKVVLQNKRNMMQNNRSKRLFKALKKQFAVDLKLYLENKNTKEILTNSLRNFLRHLDKMQKKNIAHKNKVARIKSKFQKLFNTLIR
jgi:ribosomal protein S20